MESVRENTQFENNMINQKILLKNGQKVSSDDLTLLLDDKMLDDMAYLRVDKKENKDSINKQDYFESKTYFCFINNNRRVMPAKT